MLVVWAIVNTQESATTDSMLGLRSGKSLIPIATVFMHIIIMNIRRHAHIKDIHPGLTHMRAISVGKGLLSGRYSSKAVLHRE